ncbi:HNH endonuclease motif protein [Salmonella phage F115]|uniref:HNH endonuclease motif protein n=1 Tax=Salmonella phage F61 TaxID=2982033 RepID=A0A977WM90_9CAUD|nr:HNH endonuclease motif protein [Salmonella phage F115]UXM05382.1 HNH endonuclease motif protein [Salmonella phage F61]
MKVTKGKKETWELAKKCGIDEGIAKIAKYFDIKDVCVIVGDEMAYVEERPRKVHRVIWEIHNGKIPDGMEVDHIDHNKLNNNIENLRLVSKKENHKNMPLQKNNKSGFCGVCFIERCNKYRSSIKVDGKTKYLGYFIDINDAIKARIDANKIFGFHNNHGG